MKKITKKAALVAVLSVFATGAAGMALATGCNKGDTITGYIDAPSITIEEDLGTYVIPEYDVVDSNGMILAGYNVYLKSAKNADGEALDITYGAVTVDVAGIYTFTYSAGSSNVSDVTVTIDFADRTAPTISYDERNLPDFFIRGNSYRMPAYTLSGDYVRNKCWAKVFYIAEDGTETEVQIESGRFLVDKATGSYAIRVHVEDAVGNANDYEYVRKVDGPEKLVENRVLYFNEEFGARQVSCYESAYKGEFVSKDTDGAKVYEGEEGAYKVTFDGVTETRDNEGYISMNVPALLNIYEYEAVEIWIYNDSENDVLVGANYWNDTKIEKGKWTKVSFSTREWGGNNVSMDVNNKKPVGINDITGMTIRFIFDYGQKVIPNGTFYLSSMNAVPKVESNVIAVEQAEGGVLFDQNRFFINDTVTLSAKKVANRVVDCYKVDGKIIAGNTFTVTKDEHRVEVVYADDPLTAGDMHWATPDYVKPVGEDAQTTTLGAGKNWVLKFDVYDVGASGWNYFAAYVGGTNQLLGFELANETGKFCGYGGDWKWQNGVALSSEMVSILRSATEAKPATVTYLRDGNIVKTFVEYDGVSHFIAAVDIVNTLKCRDGNNFGLGGRDETHGIKNVPVHNIRAIESKEKTEIVHATYGATVIKGDDVIDFTNKQYRIGDTVTLAAPKQNNGKLFFCFQVGGKNISGNSFVITDNEVTVTAVYTDPCEVTLAEGLSVDGKTGTITVASGTEITVKYSGQSPEGKYFAGVFVGSQSYEGGSFTVTENVSITVKYEDRVENDNEKLNDISKAEENGGLVYHPTQNGWKPASVEYVTDFGYDGPDGTVDANNSLKVTLSGGEQAFALNNGVGDLDKYEEIYFYVYTETSGGMIGGWWCRDVALVAGQWTKVSFNRSKSPQNIAEKSVWTEGLNQFVYSITGTSAGTVVYVTAVYGVPYADVTVNKDAATEQYLELSSPKYGTNYKQNETVTLTCNGAPANKAFASFTVNGEDIVGDKYVLTADGATFGIRFEDISTLTLENGANTESGETIFGRGVKVKLTHAAAEGGKVFDYYLVDDTLKIYDDTFTTTAATHKISAVYASSKQTITWGEGDETRYTKDNVMGNAQTAGWLDGRFNGQIFGSAEYWAIKANVKTANAEKWHSVTFVTGSKESVVIRWYGTGEYFAFTKIQENGNENAPAGTQFDYAYLGASDMNSRTEEQRALRRLMTGKLSAGTDITFVRYGEEIRIYADNQQVFTLAVSGKLDVSGDWFGIGTGYDPDAPEVKNISFITGKDKIDAHIETTLAIKVADGADGSLVKYTEDRSYTLPAAKAYDLFGNLSANTVTATVTDAAGNAVEVSGGKITIPEYVGSQFVTVTYTADGCIPVSIKVNFQKADSNVLLTASELGVANIGKNGNTVSYSTEFKHGDDEGSIKVNIASNETGVILNKSEYSRYVEFYAYTPDGGFNTGAWWCCNHSLAANAWTRVVIDTQGLGYDKHNDEIIIRLFENSQGKTVYISSVRTFNAESASETQLTDISYFKTKENIKSMEYVTDKKYVGDDENVKESGSLKVTVSGTDCGLASSVNFTTDLSNYSEVYFYVYTEVEKTAYAGAYWCGNTKLVAGQWTRVSLTASLANGGPWNFDGTRIFEVGLKDMVIRFMDGCADGDVFYVTSLYGVPKN